MILRKRLFVARNGSVHNRLDEEIRVLLGRLIEELREILLVDEGDDIRRLYPTAYPDDPDSEERFGDMVHDQLLMQRLDAIDAVSGSLDADVLDVETADAWMSTINQIRLVLGTRLDVGEDDRDIDEDDPNVQAHVVYQLMSYLLEELTTARIELL